MKRIKIIYVILLIGSVVLVSLRGEEIFWLLFYFMLTVPVPALLYVLYVFLRLRIRQQVARYVNKGERIPYKIKLANEDWFLMNGIGLNFYTDMVQVMKKHSDGGEILNTQEPDSISLLPYQQEEIDLALYCKYRGTYPVGVKSVSVTDFFGLFTITYPMTVQIRVTARPRILTLMQLQLSLDKKDPKKTRPVLDRLQEMLDFELRQYVPGDSLRHIHWKNSARMGELLVRKQEPQELYELVVIMDCSRVENKSDLVRMQIEDNIIETAVALLYDACMKKVRTHVVWCTGELNDMQIDNPNDFDKFYNFCAELSFEAEMTLEEVWKAAEKKTGGNPAFWLIGCGLPPELMQTVDKSRRMGQEVMLIDTGEAPL